jgi:hypothetical protein
MFSPVRLWPVTRKTREDWAVKRTMRLVDQITVIVKPHSTVNLPFMRYHLGDLIGSFDHTHSGRCFIYGNDGIHIMNQTDSIALLPVVIFKIERITKITDCSPNE